MEAVKESTRSELTVEDAVNWVGSSLKDLNYYNIQISRYSWIGEQLKKVLPAGAKVGDIGAAPGHISRMLKKIGFDVTAYDFNPDADMWESPGELGFAQVLRNEGIKVNHWDVEVEDSRTVPAEPQVPPTLDAVVFTEILEHIYRYPFASVRQVSHLVKPGGYIVLTTPNRAYAWFRLKALMGGSSDTEFKLLRDSFPPHMRHVWQYTLAECCEILNECGFDIVTGEVKSFHLWTSRSEDGTTSASWKPTNLKQILKLPLALFLALFPGFGSTVCVVGRKRGK
ncbi:MAG TPA: class I SAM-dependent methyltransferase [Drouetiella sp.]